MIGIIGVIFNKSIIWSVRGELSPSALEYSSLKKRIALQFFSLFKRKIVFHSTSLEETLDIHRQFGEKVKVVQLPNYIELPQKLNSQKQENPYLLYLGRIHPIKGIENLLKALKISKQFSSSKFHLKIAGDYENDYGKKLLKLISELELTNKVQFLGKIEGNKKEQVLANAYTLILPSYSENFGNVVVEALAQGTPVIASQGTPWSILEKNQAGIWINNTPNSLAVGIDKMLLLNQSSYSEYRQNAYALVKNEFDVFEKVDNWIKEYTTILNT